MQPIFSSFEPFKLLPHHVWFILIGARVDSESKRSPWFFTFLFLLSSSYWGMRQTSQVAGWQEGDCFGLMPWSSCYSAGPKTGWKSISKLFLVKILVCEFAELIRTSWISYELTWGPKHFAHFFHFKFQLPIACAKVEKHSPKILLDLSGMDQHAPRCFHASSALRGSVFQDRMLMMKHWEADGCSRCRCKPINKV